MTQTVIKVLHWSLFVMFVGTAVSAFVIWLGTNELPLAGFIAVIAAFFATASAFLDRLFPSNQE